MEKFGKIVAGVLLVALNMMLTMITVSYLWLWFIVPLGAASITWAHAFGLSLIVVFFQNRNKSMFKPDMFVKMTVSGRLGKNIGLATASLLIGYVTQLFM